MIYDGQEAPLTIDLLFETGRCSDQVFLKSVLASKK